MHNIVCYVFRFVNLTIFVLYTNSNQIKTKTGATEAYITVFKPKHPGQDKDGPRLWNDQLLQYASYRQRKGEGDQGVVIGDQKNVRSYFLF